MNFFLMGRLVLTAIALRWNGLITLWHWKCFGMPGNDLACEFAA